MSFWPPFNNSQPTTGSTILRKPCKVFLAKPAPMADGHFIKANGHFIKANGNCVKADGRFMETTLDWTKKETQQKEHRKTSLSFLRVNLFLLGFHAKSETTILGPGWGGGEIIPFAKSPTPFCDTPTRPPKQLPKPMSEKGASCTRAE